MRLTATQRSWLITALLFSAAIVTYCSWQDPKANDPYCPNVSCH